jgi:hypothetical protein
MRKRLDRLHRALPLALGIVTLATVAVLLWWDAFPARFAADAHNLLGALPLALIAVAYLAYQTVRRPGPAELTKAVLLAVAFLLWAANQYWPQSPHAMLWNDLAIALFVLDVAFVIAGWPSSSGDESFAESCPQCERTILSPATVKAAQESDPARRGRD